MYICTYVHMYVCMYVCMHVCMYVCAYVDVYVDVYAGGDLPDDISEMRCWYVFLSKLLFNDVKRFWHKANFGKKQQPKNIVVLNTLLVSLFTNLLFKIANTSDILNFWRIRDLGQNRETSLKRRSYEQHINQPSKSYTHVCWGDLPACACLHV